ncbi:GNAT family N-acetyltransferase [Streptomyces sp. NBC_01546]|uniref:GNAT family N-acetyltransferase n=1 Tax=Streptomyces sp. NBC_01546 TaxID=2975872 RepID=UPI00386E0618
MIEIAPQQLPALSPWFPTGSPGLGALAEHVLTTGTGHWWADRPDRPRVLAVTCADHVLLRGDPGVLTPDTLARFADQYVETPERFWPALGSAYEDIAVVTLPDRRRERLALACVAGLTADIQARGHTASWCCSRDNRPSRLLAWTAGFRLTREYLHHATGRALARKVRATPVPA